MAWLEQQPNGRYHLAFRFGDRKYKKSLRTKDSVTAEARRHRLEENLRLVESGRLAIPPDADVPTFLLSDGRIQQKREHSSTIRTLRQLCEAFLASIPSSSLEENTIATMERHIAHLKRLIGGALLIRSLQLSHIQDYVDKRAKEEGIRQQTVRPATIKMELTTFRVMWNWARNADHFQRPLPLKGIRYPKSGEKPAFQTWVSIERKIARGGLTQFEEAELWDCLFLTLPEVEALLAHVKESARHAFIYPMVVFAAHTGTRRSELMRSRIDDIDLNSGTAIVREKKRVRGKRTTRTVPISPLLEDVLRKWIDEQHPGGQYTFCLGADVPRSKKNRTEFAQLTPSEAHNHLQRTLAGSRWERIRGWHIFRHSFCSNCAASGIDQRIINAWVGHQTEEMVRRYRHLIPNQEQAAIRTVFGQRRAAHA